MTLLTLKNAGVRTGGQWTLWDANLEINAGEIVAVFGRSGSGKSTLGRVIAGLQPLTSGSIAVCGEDSNQPLHASIALPKPAFAAELTVYENLEMFASLWGLARRKRSKEIAQLLELMGLSERRTQRAGLLASGELHRLEIARALLPDCPLIVIDSLLDTLDRDLFERLWEHLLALRRDELRTVLALTSSSKVASTCPRVAVMHRGRIEFSGRPEDFRRFAGEDMVVLGGIDNTAIRNRIEEKLSLVIQEEDGFLSFRVANGERTATDLLAEFGGELGCVYLKRPTLDDALDVITSGSASVTAGVGERNTEQQ